MHSIESLLQSRHSVGSDMDRKKRTESASILLEEGETKKRIVRKRIWRNEPDNSQRKGSDGQL
jgi:hypothetical protein